MRVLVTWGSKRGGTEGIGDMIAEALRAKGHDAVAMPVQKVHRLDGFEAVVLGGALYANRWPASARHFANRHVRALRAVPVWLFSSGPLDDSAEKTVIGPPVEVAVIGERIGSLGHITFGGRLEKDAKGFPASAIAKNQSGDFRNPEHVRAWADTIASALPAAKPGAAVDHPGRSPLRLLGYALLGWAIQALIVTGIGLVSSEGVRVGLHAVLVPTALAAVAPRYFRARGAHAPLTVAFVWASTTAALDLAIAGRGALAALESVLFTWLPLALTMLVVWAIGALMATMPWPNPSNASKPVSA